MEDDIEADDAASGDVRLTVSVLTTAMKACGADARSVPLLMVVGAVASLYYPGW